ncbi:MAG TPA: ABC transporter ATP-binding protein [Candidatus Saccharibacteria bacterium]|nr:ABC transporter ATP-binding protein [Candidatus Saccharibacteria bacterium]
MSDTAIKVDKVYKRFKLPHEKITSIKTLFTQGFRRKKGYEVQHALEDISFEIKKGEFFGIVGRNGSGKSTLLKMLAGIYQPTKGSIRTEGKLVPFIELGVGFNPELTGRENVYLNGALLGFSKKEIDAMYDDIVAFAELERFMDQKLKNYSSGMQVRLAFSVATRAKADVLLIDEVLAVGDADFQRKCYDYFKKLKKTDTTIVFVTHDMNAVKTFCDRAMLIENGEITSYGKVDDVADDYLRLFSGDSKATTKSTVKRWGSGDIKIENIELKASNLEITIDVSLSAPRTSIEEFVVGYNFRNSDGTMIMGGNNLNAISGAGKLSLQKHSHKKLTFTTPNFLGTGEYSLDVIVRDVNTTIFDKWEGAANLKVTKSESYYPTVAYATVKSMEVTPKHE